MTPQEKDLITALLNRLREARDQPKDREAEALIGASVAAQPDAPYLLVQTVLIQDLALQNAQARITELERRLADSQSAPQAPTSFLGGALGRGSVPSTGVWSRSAPAAPYAPPPGPAPAPSPAWGPGGGGGGWGQQQPMMAPSATSGFLRSAAATAAGIAGGALLFQGIQSLFGASHMGGIMGGMPMQPGISETVINNNYGDEPRSASSPWSSPGDSGGNSGSVRADNDLNDATAVGSADPGDPGFASIDRDYLADNQDLDSDPGSAPDFGSDDSSLV